jgi:hypothetical protein
VLAAAYTYILRIDPAVATGSATLTLSNDIVGTISVDGPGVPSYIGRGGQNARYTFTGTTGQLLGVGITPGGLSGTVYVVKPDGNTLDFAQFYPSSGNTITPPALPSPGGTYTLKVEPGLATGSVTLALTTDWTATFRNRIGLYESGDSTCVPDADPITLVLRMAGEPTSHLYDHGLPTDILADPFETIAEWAGESPYDYYSDNGNCVQSEILRGSNVSHEGCWQLWNYLPIYTECLRDRLHVRGHMESLWDPQYSGLRDHAMAPHLDKAIDECGDQFPPFAYRKHIVEEDVLHDGQMISGFSRARDLVMSAWIASGHHMTLDVQFWGNIGERPQCNGERPQADGYIYMVGTCVDLPSLC